MAVALLVSLGYKQAGDWDKAKLEDRLRQLPERVDKEKVPSEHEDLFKKLSELTDQENLTIEGAPAAKDEGKDSKGKGGKPAADAKDSKKGAAKAGGKGKSDKPAKAKKEKKVVEKDKFGYRVGSMLAKLSAVLTKDGQTESEIAKAAGYTDKDLKKVRGRLRRLKRNKVATAVREVKYSLAK